MSRYFFGLDGGGSKTHIVLYEVDGGGFDLYAGPQSNYEGMPGGYRELAVVLKKMMTEILGRNGIGAGDIVRAAFGMGGVDTKKQHREISRIISGLGFTDFILANDAYLGVKAGSSNGFGISCVNGSGFSVAGIDDGGGMLQIGGIGHLTGDRGGSFWLVPEAVSYAYGELFKRYEPSELTGMITRELGAGSKDDFTEELHRRLNEDDSSFRLAVSKMVFTASKNGDRAARALLKKAGESFGESVLAVLDDLNFTREPEIILTGSLFQKQPDSYIVESLKIYLDKHYGKPFTARVLDAPSVLGALVWAAGDEGIGKRDELKNKINRRMTQDAG